MARRYDALLQALRLRDDHVTARYGFARALGYVGYRLPILLVRLPFALVGMALNYLPYRIPGWVAGRFASSGALRESGMSSAATGRRPVARSRTGPSPKPTSSR